MYLSLPIPHALEEQLGGNAVPSHISVCGGWGGVGDVGWEGCGCVIVLPPRLLNPLPSSDLVCSQAQLQANKVSFH